jgi:CheY-like chemotaxis protein
MIHPSKPTQRNTKDHREGNRDVLVIDDRLENRLLLRRALTQLDYRVETAVDGEQGWRKLLQRSFRFIVTDYEMPNLDGLKLIERIRRCSSNRIRRSPVILHSAINDATLRRAVRGDDRTYFFPKPLDVRRLAKLLRQLSRRKEEGSRENRSPSQRTGDLLRLALPLTNFRSLMVDL